MCLAPGPKNLSPKRSIDAIPRSILVVVVRDLEFLIVVREFEVIVLKFLVLLTLLIIVPLELVVIIDKVLVLFLLLQSHRRLQLQKTKAPLLSNSATALGFERFFPLHHDTLSQARPCLDALLCSGFELPLRHTQTPSRSPSVGTIQLDPALSIPLHTFFHTLPPLRLS